MSNIPPSQPILTADQLRQAAADETRLRYLLMDLANRLPDVISLGQGDPDLDTPPHVIAAAQDAIRNGRADIPAPPEGLPELREAIACKLQRDNHIPAEADNLLVTNGSQEALYLVVQGLLDPGDEILVPDPRYSGYDQAIQQAGGKVVFLPTMPEHDFELQPQVVAESATAHAKVLLLITPGNPTASIISPTNLRAIANIARERGLIVISDEIYEKHIYPPGEHLSIASLSGMFERTVTINGFSKSYAMTGWRVGYVAAPSEFIRVLTTLKRSVSRRTPTVSQYAALAALNGPQDFLEGYHAIYSRRRAILLNGLRQLGFYCAEPLGAFFIFVNAAATGMPALELCYRLLNEGHVLIFPGDSFGEKWTDWLRVSYLQDESALQEALARIARVLKRKEV
jgi:aspartate/methionine/tyrosine aminotransferase